MRRHGIGALAGLVLAGALAGCAAQEEAALDKVRVCEVTHSIFYAPQYAALELGFFEDEGIEVELSNGGGADKVMSAVLSDNIDIGFAGPEASIYVYNEGKEDHTQVFAQMTRRDGSMLVGRTPEEDFDWKNLAGAHILPGRKGGVPYMAFEYAIRQSGLDPEMDVYLDTSVQFDNMTGAFLGGTGDYVTMFEPSASSVQAEGKGYIVAAVGDAAGDLPYTAYFAKKSYLEENADLVQRFTNAVYRGQQWVASHTPEEVAKAVSPQFADTDLALLESAVANYQKVGAYSTEPAMARESFDNLQQIMREAGELDETAPFDEVVNNTFAERAVQDAA